tara:strand:- start:436 stop:996 length:561 start_codon:yes stop_codon:yes gene_type:complete
MANKISILGQDPAFSNFGLALVDVDPITGEMSPLWIDLIETKKSTVKTVRVSSDKLHRARIISVRVREAEEFCTIIAAEIPSGAQSASASNALGIALGIVSGHTKPLIQVSAAEAKKAATGYSDASKGDMVQWAYELWPDLTWVKGRSKDMPEGLANKNEHMADALAIVKASIETQTFKTIASVLK